MGVNRNTLRTAAVVLAIVVGWSVVQSARGDIAVLRTFDVDGMDLYTTLWTLEDGRYVWVRANRPEREWLAHMRRNPDVELQHHGQIRKYHASFERARSETYVQAGFREKYGLADRWREMTSGDDVVLVRLAPR